MELRVAVLGAGLVGHDGRDARGRNAPTRALGAARRGRRRRSTSSTPTSATCRARALPRALRATDSIEEAVRDADVRRDRRARRTACARVLEEVKKFLRPWVPIISLSKGLEQRHASAHDAGDPRRAARPSAPARSPGPNLAREIMAGFAAASVIAIDDERVARQLQRVFHSGLFRVYTNHDVIGCELGGALKNVIAIAAGMGDGLGVGDNTRAAVITRGLAEITRLGVAMGGERAHVRGPRRHGRPDRHLHRARRAATATSASSSAAAARSTRSSPRCTWWPRASRRSRVVLELRRALRRRAADRARGVRRGARGPHRARRLPRPDPPRPGAEAEPG